MTKRGGHMAYYVPSSKKVGGHVPRVLHQIAPMYMTDPVGGRFESIVLTDSTYDLLRCILYEWITRFLPKLRNIYTRNTSRGP